MFPIEIKVNLDTAVADAIAVLDRRRSEMRERQIWFADDATSGELTPLMNAGVIIRVRSGDGADDMTVKLRPCLQSQLIGRWATPFGIGTLDYRIEGDWSTQRHVLAASAVVEHPQGSLLDAVRTGADAAQPLTADQRQFFEACARQVPPLTDSPAVPRQAVDSAHSRLQIDNLVAFGPIASTKWTDVAIGEVDVNMERWTVGDLDLLELSLRVKPKASENAPDFESRAARKLEKLQAAVRSQGLAIADESENKTQRVMAALVAVER